MKTLVVIPTYNERENLEHLIPAISALSIGISVLVVDDNSPDGTGELADSLAKSRPSTVHVLHRPGKAGLGGAYLDGFRWGLERSFDVMCEMDADFSHDPADLSRLLMAIDDGADLAIGSRRARGGRIIGWGAHRHLMSFGANALARRLLGLKSHDVTAGFRAYRRPVVEMILESDVRSDGYAFQEETLFLTERAGFQITEVPVIFRDRIRGSSKLSPKEAVGYFNTLWRLMHDK